MKLSELKTGEKGVIIKVTGHGGFRKRIVEMGFIKGKEVTSIINAPLHDPIKYNIMGYDISLRRQEAEMIEIISQQEAIDKNNIPQFHGSIEEYDPEIKPTLKEIALGKRRTINVALVGNPNCGKTSLFNITSGAHERVGNYSGVTVDAKEGFFDFEGYHFRIIDLPGTYSLSAYTPEELYVRKYIIDETPDIIINVVDASNLERNLYLTTQLIDMNVRTVVALNMYDELQDEGSRLDYCRLSELFGMPMIPTICKKNKGIDTLLHVVINLYEGADFLDKSGKMFPEVAKELIEWHHSQVDETHHKQHIGDYVNAAGNRVCRHLHINHGQEIETSIKILKKEISINENIRHKYSTRFLAIKLLENDKKIIDLISSLPNGDNILNTLKKEQSRIQDTLNEDSESAITDAKYGFVAGALKETFDKTKREKNKRTKTLDSFVMHRFWGYPIFFLLIFIMFESTFVIGAYPMKWIESGVEILNNWINNFISVGPLNDLVTNGIIGGVGGAIIFLPNILILYLCISFLEDSGYMARAAFLMDKIMHRMGIHGKSFIPIIMSFGCNVPAVMATRTIESRKSRLITMLIIPLLSCSSRLPVYIMLTSAFFPKHKELILLCIYALSILTTIGMAQIFSKFIVKEEDTPFVMELPPYRIPTAKIILRHAWEKGIQYLKKMGTIILAASIIIWFLSYYPNHDKYDNIVQQQENSYIGKIGKFISPAIEPLGFDWKMGVGLISGLGAKEIIVSTLNIIYTDGNETNDLGNRMPITPVAALSYIVFIMFYFPCTATLAAIKQESGKWKWVLFSILYTTSLAWILSFSFYQIGCLL